MKKLAALAVLLVGAGGPDYAKLLAEAKISLVDAIDKAVQEAGGGTPVAACLEKEHPRTVFEVALAKDDRKIEISLAAADGSFVAREEEKHDHSKLAARFSAPLRQMIVAAIQRTGGSAVAAELHGTEEATATIDTWADGKLHRVTLDAKGTILKVADACDDDEDDD